MATPAPKRPRPYRDYLTPALHRQFTRAAGLAVSVCYVESIWMGASDLFWSWFPLGPAGARASMLAISVLLVMIVRISRLHVGRRTTASPFETLRSQLFAVSTYVTFAWYITSALLFAEVYVWTQPHDAGFGVIHHGRAHERARLNERAIAFRTLFVMLGIVQSLIHLFSDRDRVPSPTRKVKVDSKAVVTLNPVDSPSILIRKLMPGIVVRFVWTASLFPVIAFMIYVFTPLRSIAWSIAFDTLRFVYFLPTKQRNAQTGFAPIVPFYFATLVQTMLLVLLWEITNAAFSAYIAQPPLRREEPLTSEQKATTTRPVDPNGSLINGLKSKKDFARASAFHELLLITVSFPERRKSIYAELDRVGGNTWTQVLQLCLEQINGITTRINALNTTPAAPVVDVPERQKIAPPLKTENVFADQPLGNMGTPARTGEWAKSWATKYGNSPGAEPVKDIAKFAGRKLLTEDQRQRLAAQPAEVEKRVEGLWDVVIKSPVGWPFRKSFDRQVTAIVCGRPHSKTGVIVDAIDSLSRLVVESMKEDVYGQVSNDVGSIMRTYVSTLKAIQGYMKEAKPHWSDVTFTKERREEVKEVNDVMNALSDGLAAMLGAFGEYSDSIGLGIAEVKEIKSLIAEAAAKKDVAARAANAGQQADGAPREDEGARRRKEELQDRRERREMEQIR